MILWDDKEELITSGRLTIDLKALAHNWQFLRDLVNEDNADVECSALIKADAYGLSVKRVIQSLVVAGCKTFFVATIEEGIEVRKCNQDITIYVLNGLSPGTCEAFGNHNLQPVLNSMEEITEWAESPVHKNPAALHVDTGMNRLGLREDEAKALSRNKALMDKLNLSLLLSHLACGDSPSALMNGCQLRSFMTICEDFPGVPRSLCNSAGIFHGSSFHLDMVRPGISLYGGAALKSHRENNPMKPVVKAEARILQLRIVEKDESVGYGAQEVVDRQTRIATLSIGYADGYLRQAGSATGEKGAFAYIKGQRVPLVGRISMDLMAVDVTGIEDVKRGDYVELFGPNIPISEVASHSETIDYEFLTRLSKRYHRRYAPLGGSIGQN